MKELRWSEVNGVVATAKDFPLSRVLYLPVSCGFAVATSAPRSSSWRIHDPGVDLACEVLDARWPWTPLAVDTVTTGTGGCRARAVGVRGPSSRARISPVASPF